MTEDNEFVEEARDGRRYFNEMREMGTRRVVVVLELIAEGSVVEVYFGGDTERCLIVRRSSIEDFFE